MNLQFHNHIDLIPREDVDTINGNEIVPIEGRSCDQVLTDNDIRPSEQPEERNGNVYYRQKLSIVADKLDPALEGRYRNNRPVIAKLYRSDGQGIIWGDRELPVRVSLIPHPGHTALELTRNAPDPML